MIKGHLSNRQKIFCEHYLKVGLENLEPTELIECCYAVITFVAIAFRKEHLTKLELEDTLVKKLKAEFNWAYDQEGPQTAFADVRKYMKEMGK